MEHGCGMGSWWQVGGELEAGGWRDGALLWDGGFVTGEMERGAVEKVWEGGGG